MSFKKNIKGYIPGNLDLDKLLKTHQPNFSYQKDKFVCLLDKIYDMSLMYMKDDGFVEISATYLKSQSLYDYKNYLEWLEDVGVIEVNKQYVVGEKSRSYRLSTTYSTRMISYSYTSKNANKLKIVVDPPTKMNTEPHVYHLYACLKKLEFKSNDAYNYIQTNYAKDVNTSVKEKERKYNAGYIAIQKLENKEYYFNRDNTSYRVHSNITGLKTDLRSFAQYEQKKIYSIDFANSQPYLSLLILNKEFWNRKQYLKYNSDIDNLSIIMILEESQGAGFDDVKVYRDLVVNGGLYAYMKTHLINNCCLNKDATEKDVKKKMFEILFTDNRYIHQKEALAKKVFKQLFPTVYKVFSIVKKGNKANLPILLQKIESELVIDTIVKRVYNKNKKIPLFTIHDSVATTEEYVRELERIMEEESIKLVGEKPTFKIEVWG